jgi:hypothetical protein
MASTITYSQYSMAAGPVPATGKIVSDGDAVNVEVGFVPSAVMIFVEDAGGTDFAYVWMNGMGDGQFLMSAGAFTAASSGAQIAPYVGDDDSAKGFTLAATALANNDVVYFIAFP